MRNRTNSVISRFGLACLVLFICHAVGSAQDVRYNYVPGTDFSKYKTYKWVEVPGAKHPDQITDGQIRQAVDSQMAEKGFTKTEADNPDLYLTYQVAVDKEKQWNSYSTGGFGWRWGGGMTTATSSNINIGTLVLDIYDVAAKQQVWRGDATKTLNPSKNPEKNLENLQKSVAKLMKNFPPPPGK